MRKVLVDKNGLVVNAIEIGEEANWTPPEGCSLLSLARSKQADIGDTWDGNKIVKAVIPEPLPPRDLAKEVDEIKASLGMV